MTQHCMLRLLPKIRPLLIFTFLCQLTFLLIKNKNKNKSHRLLSAAIGMAGAVSCMGLWNKTGHMLVDWKRLTQFSFWEQAEHCLLYILTVNLTYLWFDKDISDLGLFGSRYSWTRSDDELVLYAVVIAKSNVDIDVVYCWLESARDWRIALYKSDQQQQLRLCCLIWI